MQDYYQSNNTFIVIVDWFIVKIISGNSFLKSTFRRLITPVTG